MLATSDWRTVLAARWRATPSGPFFQMSNPHAEFLQRLPKEYRAAVAEFRAFSQCQVSRRGRVIAGVGLEVLVLVLRRQPVLVLGMGAS